MGTDAYNDNYALKFKKGKAVCLICGHEWEAEEGMCRCPHCGAKVEVKSTTQSSKGRVVGSICFDTPFVIG